MKTQDKILENFHLSYQFKNRIPMETLLFFDIETTGFTAKSSNLYLIGCAFYENENWHIRQFFAENTNEEADILHAFFDLAKNYTHLVHFNGNHFDLPYVTQKCQQLSLPYSFDDFTGIDIYKRISPYRFFLKLPNCRQKTIERFLMINREDTFSGGDLIKIYLDYVNQPDEESFHLLTLHNMEDVMGMMEILPILAYHDLFNSDIKAKKVQINSYSDVNGIVQKELFIKLLLPTPLPAATSFMCNNCYFTGEGDSAALKVPLYEEELKYFYSNYNDYYYLPNEDLAMHKSVATFVDKDCREKATARNCYTRKQSVYLPQWDYVFEPFFKRDYSSKELFFELTDEIKTDRSAFNIYAAHILEMMLHNY